jgi:hypothetical protein
MGIKRNYRTGFVRCSGCYKLFNLHIASDLENIATIKGIEYHHCCGRYNRLRYHAH